MHGGLLHSARCGGGGGPGMGVGFGVGTAGAVPVPALAPAPIGESGPAGFPPADPVPGGGTGFVPPGVPRICTPPCGGGLWPGIQTWPGTVPTGPIGGSIVTQAPSTAASSRLLLRPASASRFLEVDVFISPTFQ